MWICITQNICLAWCLFLECVIIWLYNIHHEEHYLCMHSIPVVWYIYIAATGSNVGTDKIGRVYLMCVYFGVPTTNSPGISNSTSGIYLSFISVFYVQQKEYYVISQCFPLHNVYVGICVVYASVFIKQPIVLCCLGHFWFVFSGLYLFKCIMMVQGDSDNDLWWFTSYIRNDTSTLKQNIPYECTSCVKVFILLLFFWHFIRCSE